MKKIDTKLLKFILVGIINTLFGTTIMFLCYNLIHLSYWLSSAANYFFGSILSYVLNKYFTFESKKKSLFEIIRFTLNIVMCYLMAYGVAKPLARYFLISFDKSMQENIAMFIGMCFFVCLNYLGQRYFVFKEKQ